MEGSSRKVPLFLVHQTGLYMQVCDAARGSDEARSFCNTWIEQLVIQLPSLAVAIDDSLMALVERCVQHINSPALTAHAQPTQHRGRTEQTTGADAHSPGTGPSWTPSATSPMTLLEQARRAKQLNDALDSFGAGKSSGAVPPYFTSSSPFLPTLFDQDTATGPRADSMQQALLLKVCPCLVTSKATAWYLMRSSQALSSLHFYFLCRLLKPYRNMLAQQKVWFCIPLFPVSMVFKSLDWQTLLGR